MIEQRKNALRPVWRPAVVVSPLGVAAKLANPLVRKQRAAWRAAATTVAERAAAILAA